MDKPVAIVSGAGGGLGIAIVQRLVDDGFAVAGCDLGAGADCALHAEVDVVDRGAVGAFVARVESELGPLGVVVTAAGVQRTGASEVPAAVVTAAGVSRRYADRGNLRHLPVNRSRGRRRDGTAHVPHTTGPQPALQRHI